MQEELGEVVWRGRREYGGGLEREGRQDLEHGSKGLPRPGWHS